MKITTEIGGRRCDMVVGRRQVAIYFDDNLSRWVAVRGDGETRLLSEEWDWMCDGNAIDAAAAVFGVSTDDVFVDLVNA